MAKKLVKNYVFSPGQGLDDNLRPNTYSLILQNRTFIIKEIVAYIQNLIDAGDPDYVGYTYNTSKCERDAGYVIDALLFDLRYGGNEETRRVSSRYWNNEVAQIDGSRIPEYEAYQFARDLINTYIITNTEDLTPEQLLAVQVFDGAKTAEAGSATRISTLLDDVVTVIQNGLSSLPALEIGLGRIEILGKVGLEDLLIISNVTDNSVIYNFAEPTKGGQVTFNPGNSESYPQAISVNNGTTVINLKYNTSAMSSDDSIQIFLEESELRVRMNDIATDAMERIKVGIPQAMLDADFEYGLQPTKWQALSLQRGYPSTYEIPASDIPVTSVVTDASTGTSGVGSSLITVTTTVNHGLSVGQPITIRALASSVTGFNRAEGTFIVVSTPSVTTFTYYAKSKVGTSNGQVLATTTTQLRQAGFYTGAAVRGAEIVLESNGSSGSFTTALVAPSGSTTLTFVGSIPPLGSPLSASGIASGTQVTGVFGPSNSDGLFDQRFVAADFTSGGTTISVTDVSGIQEGMAVGNGDVPEQQIIITSVSGFNLNLSGPLNRSFVGNESSYSNLVLSSTNYIAGTGLGATFDVSITSGISTPTLNSGGSGYLVGDTLKILGSLLGGTDGVNDLFLYVTGVSSGAITTFAVAFGSDVDQTGTANFTNVAAVETVNERATNGEISILRTNGGYSPITVITSGSGFLPGNRFLIDGALLGGVSVTNDAIVTVSGESSISSFTVSGVGVIGEQLDIYCTVTISEATTGSIAATTTVTYSSIATLRIDFPTNHGLVPGSNLMIGITSTGTNHALAAGPYFVTDIPSLTSIRYIARAGGTIDNTVPLQGTVYIRPDSFFSHRPFDGGVQLGTGGPQHGSHAVRMSKKYIRYQSGKGAMYNTGALFAPSFDIGSITAAGTTVGSIITVATDDNDHGLQAGARIRISGVQTTGYDGDYTVTQIVDERTFRITAQTQLGSVTGTVGSLCQMALLNWHGAIVRSGPFDDQNGIFWQYDGNVMAVGRRTSTFQLAGTIAIQTDRSLVTGTNTRFLDQLQEGDRIVIRGMTHVVTNIASNTSMTVSPSFRGIRDISGVKAAKVEDIIIPQNEWNLDRCDGTGPSGYEIDVTKMQMIGVQFTWYGAGFTDWMLRGPDGNYVFCHRLKGNNLNTEAYMRTGNLPVRYEVINESARSRLRSSITDSDTTLPLSDVSQFPDAGVVYIDNEVISYTGRNTTTRSLTGCTRSASLSNFAAGSTRTYTAGPAAAHNEKQGVVLISNTTSPIISHWGSAYLIDGQFDEDRGYIFSYAATGLSVGGNRKTAFLIRLAPSVSNAVTGDLGERELLNRAQLLLSAISVTSDPQSTTDSGGIVIEGILNPKNYPVIPSNITWNGLSSEAAGGQPSFAQVALGGSVTWGAATTTASATISGAVTTTISAVATSVTTQSINAYTYRSNFFGGSSPAFSSSRNDFYVLTSDYDALTATPLRVGDRISVSGIVTSGQTITSIERNYASYYYGGTNSFAQMTRIRMSSNANSTSSNSSVATSITNAISQTYNTAIRNGQRDFLITTTDYTNSGILTGDGISGTNITNKTISSIETNYVRINNVVYVRILVNSNASGNSTPGSSVSITATASGTGSTYSITNTFPFTAASFTASGATIGTRLDATVTQFPAGTSVSNVQTRTLGATTFYRVTFSQSSNTNINAASTLLFAFGADFAVPGELVFSFISNPGETSTLDLSELKELTTTAIGGRGTFPNGPDVLAINVYKVGGAEVDANVILRWGEAQA